MTRFYPLLLSTAALALAACGEQAVDRPETAPPAEPPPAATSDLARLTPDGWGALRIGMTRAEVEAAMGGPARGDSGAAEPAVCDEFRPARAPEALLVMLEDNRLTRISLTAPSDITTEQGYGVGDPGAGIKAALGAAAIVEPHKYIDAPAEYITVWRTGGGADFVTDAAARGLVFEVGADGAVSAIHAGGPSIQYVEGCS